MTDNIDIRKRQGLSFRQSQSFVKELLIILIISLTFFGVYYFCFQIAQVHGNSMVDTLHEGDLLLTAKFPYYYSDPGRGDIVIINSTVDQTTIVKRVIGLPGDKIEINGNGANPQVKIQVQGSSTWQVVKEPYLPDKWVTATNCCDIGGRLSPEPQPVTIPSGEYFVLGDNRNVSKDSRYLGFINKSEFVSHVIFRFWPLSRFGGFATGPTLASLAIGFPLFFRRKKLKSALRKMRE